MSDSATAGYLEEQRFTDQQADFSERTLLVRFDVTEPDLSEDIYQLARSENVGSVEVLESATDENKAFIPGVLQLTFARGARILEAEAGMKSFQSLLNLLPGVTAEPAVPVA